MLSVKDKVGALYDLLRPFASHGLNMTKIESRPSRRKAWEYLFFVDIEGHMDEERVKKAMEDIKGRCLFMKILGSYPGSQLVMTLNVHPDIALAHSLRSGKAHRRTAARIGHSTGH